MPIPVYSLPLFNNGTLATKQTHDAELNRIIQPLYPLNADLAQEVVDNFIQDLNDIANLVGTLPSGVEQFTVYADTDEQTGAQDSAFDFTDTGLAQASPASILRAVTSTGAVGPFAPVASATTDP